MDVLIIQEVVQTPVDDVDLLLRQIQQHLFLTKLSQREVVSGLRSLVEESLHFLDARCARPRDATVVLLDAPFDDFRNSVHRQFNLDHVAHKTSSDHRGLILLQSCAVLPGEKGGSAALTNPAVRRPSRSQSEPAGALPGPPGRESPLRNRKRARYTREANRAAWRSPG